MIARAGHQKALPMPGAMRFSVSDCSAAKRDSVLVERIASACTPMTKMAPTTAAMICATSRVRRGPSSAEERHRHRQRDRRGGQPHRDGDAVGAEPARRRRE